MMVNRRSFVAGCFSLCASAGLGGVKSAPARRITIAHCGDPQLGYDAEFGGEAAYQACLKRLEREIAKINEVKPDCVCFAGDMVHDWQQAKRDCPRLLKEIRCPWMVTAGNHDIPDARSEEQPRAFAEVFGCDHSAKTVKGWRIISFNGQFERDPGHHAEYVAWRDAELAALKASGLPGVVLTHQPMLLEKVDEGDTKENYPKTIRKDLMDRMADAGVRFVLAGHTHRLQLRACRGIPVLNAETTCRNFDERPFGFRLLKADVALDYSWDFVST